ncbi:MAG: hypothetical protein AAFO06_17820 [Cyanobacteria bacterium J06597_16]
MHLTTLDNNIKIQLDPSERLWAFHLNRQIEVPLDTVESVRLERPETTWNELRAPGTYLPGFIRAGTYYTQRGREFWYVNKASNSTPNCLCVDMSEGYYKRIVLESGLAGNWRAQIQRALASLEEGNSDPT